MNFRKKPDNSEIGMLASPWHPQLLFEMSPEGRLNKIFRLAHKKSQNFFNGSWKWNFEGEGDCDWMHQYAKSISVDIHLSAALRQIFSIYFLLYTTFIESIFMEKHLGGSKVPSLSVFFFYTPLAFPSLAWVGSNSLHTVSPAFSAAIKKWCLNLRLLSNQNDNAQGISKKSNRKMKY